MKRNRMTLVILLAAVLTLAVGYALFSQTINITGTATAQGSFDIVASCTPNLDSSISSIVIGDGDASDYVDKGVSSASCSNDSQNPKKINFSVALDYPGAQKYMTVKITNNGTIDANINMQDPTMTTENKLCIDGADFTQSVVPFEETDGQITESTECIDGTRTDLSTNQSYTISYYQLLQGGAFVYEKSDGTKMLYSDDNISYFMDEDGYVRLRPRESMYIVLKFYMLSIYDRPSLLIKNDLSFDFKYSQEKGQ